MNGYAFFTSDLVFPRTPSTLLAQQPLATLHSLDYRIREVIMDWMDLTLSDTASNLALDEALLEEAECAERPREVIRVWESRDVAVVLGRSSRWADETRAEACRRQGVSIFRRCSGGASVVIGPGCLMYSLILNLEQRPYLRAVDQAHAWVLGRLAAALGELPCGAVQHKGISDLAIGDRKFSGNSLRYLRRSCLYHGTVLYDFPLQQIYDLLAVPPREPDYRRGRDHRSFVTNLPVSAEQLRRVFHDLWRPDRESNDWPKDRVDRLVSTRYALDRWNRRR